MIPVKAVQLVAIEDRHVRGNRVIATPELLDAPGAIDLTPAVVAALQRLDRELTSERPPASSEAVARRMKNTGQRDTPAEMGLRRQLHRRGIDIE